MTPRQRSNGYVLLAVLFIVTLLVNFILFGLVRSSQDLAGARLTTAMAQAFHLAEGGLDDQLARLEAMPSSAVNQLLRNLPAQLACSVPDCQLLITDDEETDRNPTRDTNGLVVISATGTTGGIARRVRAIVAVDASAPETFPYGVAGSTIDMDGNATFGDSNDPTTTTIFVQGPPQAGGSFLTSGTNNVYAGLVAFHNPYDYQPSTLCTNCSDPNTFHGPPAFDWHADAPDPLTLDLRRYYDEARYQQHVITTNTRFRNQTINGVWYVECGVTIDIEGSVTLNGTLVHEGCRGQINLKEQASLTVDSTAGTRPFAPGMAIIGAPDLLTGRNTTVRVRGLVMMTGGGTSKIPSKDGLVLGSMLAVQDVWEQYPQMALNPGPGSYPSIVFPLDTLTIEEAVWVFRPLVEVDQGGHLPRVTTTLRAWFDD
jgi:hypothetical protein